MLPQAEILSLDECSVVMQDVGSRKGKLGNKYMGTLCTIFTIAYKDKIISK